MKLIIKDLESAAKEFVCPFKVLLIAQHLSKKQVTFGAIGETINGLFKGTERLGDCVRLSNRNLQSKGIKQRATISILRIQKIYGQSIVSVEFLNESDGEIGVESDCLVKIRHCLDGHVHEHIHLAAMMVNVSILWADRKSVV